MKKRANLLKLTAAGAAGFAIIFTLFSVSAAKKPPREDLYGQIELFSDAVTYIRSHYVEEVTSKDLIYGALRGMLSSLDAYSQFLDPESYKDIKVETKGEFGGLGIEIGIKDGLLTIIAPLEDSPAHKAGIKSGDRIVKIDGTLTKNIALEDAVKKLRGKPGTDVTLTVLREEEAKVLDIKITRAIIKIESIKEASILEDNIGYIRLTEFQERTGPDLEKALAKLKEGGMDSLVVDLRNNPGGLLESAIDVSGLFLAKDKTIVVTRGRDKDKEVVYKSKRGAASDYPMVVLVNGGSASASEIVAGAIQDNRRGIILGTKTFGKGSVQTVIPLKDESALRLTTAKYFTPNGRAIRDEGIMPDVVIEYETLAEKEKTEEMNIEEIFNKIEGAPEVKAPPKKEYDNQLSRAVDLLKGIKVYRARPS